MVREEGDVGRVEGRAAAVVFGEAGVVAEAEGGEGRRVVEEGVDGEGAGVHGDGEGGEGADVVLDEDVERRRGFLAEVGEVRGEIFAVEGMEIGEVCEFHGGEEVEDGHGDKLQGAYAGKVPMSGDFIGGVTPVVGADFEFTKRWKAFIWEKAELCPLAAVFEVEGFQTASRDKEGFERAEPRYKWRSWVCQFKGHQKLDRYCLQVNVAHITSEVLERELLDVELRSMISGLLRVENVGWHPEESRAD